MFGSAAHVPSSTSDQAVENPLHIPIARGKPDAENCSSIKPFGSFRLTGRVPRSGAANMQVLFPKTLGPFVGQHLERAAFRQATRCCLRRMPDGALDVVQLRGLGFVGGANRPVCSFHDCDPL